MRKIEKLLIAAIKQGKVFRRHNTEYNGYGEVRLFGNLIAALESGNPATGGPVVWKFHLRGYNTLTTRSRLNAIAQAFDRPGVVSIGGQAFCDMAAINHNDWF